jgi:hypothetical protein
METMKGTLRARAVVIAVLLVSYGALGARQPAVRTSVPLPVPASQIAQSLGLDPDDRSQLLTSIVRLLFDAPDGHSVEDQKRRASLTAQLSTAAAADQADRIPLPLDTSIWRETLLARKVTDGEIAAAILSDRSTALLYHGLAALDDDTLGWLGPDRETLLHLRRNAGVFAAFGRSVIVRAGRIGVPGGTEAEPLWAAIVGADPGRPPAFVQKLIRGNGRLAWFYDTVAHLDPPRQRLVLGQGAPEAQRVERVRELLNVFEAAAPEWSMPERPFVRPAVDPSLVVSLIAVTADGVISGPDDRRLWESVFREDAVDAAVGDGPSDQVEKAPVDVAWLTRRISLAAGAIGRRRLDTFLFAQRVFPVPPPDDTAVVVALRGAATFPAMAPTLERMGVTDAATYAAAARAATALGAIRSPEWRRVAVAEFQSALALIDRAVRMGGIDGRAAGVLAASLAALPLSAERGYGAAFGEWLRRDLVRALPLAADASDPIEESVLSALAGMRERPGPVDTVEWEGRRYRVDPVAAELKRLRRIRERQRVAQRGAARGKATLDARLAAVATAGSDDSRLPFEQALAETLTSIVYAVHLGEPEGAAVAAGDVATRHDFGFADGVKTTRSAAWRFAREEHSERAGWRLVGSLLGLDIALARLEPRRLDVSDMPGEPTMSSNERVAAMFTAALFGPLAGSDAGRDEIAAALARGRARVMQLGADDAEVERVTRDAGFSEWRREALRWTLANERDQRLARFSLVDLFWLGAPRAPARRFDAWGTASIVVDGCLCLRMPRAEPWESRTGRSSTGHLATFGADVSLRIAEVLAELKLSAALAPAVLAFATQDVIDGARPAFFDDWPAFQRTARDLPRERLIDYIAAVAADGALVPLESPSSRH